MPTIADIRAQYPQYNDIGDAELTVALHRKYYSDMPLEVFAGKIGFDPAKAKRIAAFPQSMENIAKDQESYNPTNGMRAGPSMSIGPGGRPVFGSDGLFMAGAGKFFSDTGRGIQQIGAEVADAVSPRQQSLSDLVTGNKPSRAADLYAQEAERRKLDAPLMDTAAGKAGYIGAAVSPMLAAPVPSTIRGAALFGGATAATQPIAEGESRAMNAATGAVLSGSAQGAVNVLGRIAQPVKKVVDAKYKKAVDAMEAAGVPLSVGQRTGSRTTQAVERTLGDIPASAGTMAEQGDKFRAGFTRAALRTIGADADAATPEVLNEARNRITGVMDAVESKYTIGINPQMYRESANILAKAERTVPDAAALNALKSQVENMRRIAAANGGKLPGESVRMIRGELLSLAQRSPNVAEEAGALADVLLDATQRAAKGTNDFAAYQRARAQYRNLKAIESAADTTENAAISPAKLAQTLKNGKYTRNSFRYGRGDVELAKLARSGRTVADTFPQSGTAPRLAGQVMLPAALGTASYVMNNDPEQALKVAGATFLLPKGAAWAMTRPAMQNYLVNGIGSPVVRNALMAPSRVGLGAAAGPYFLAQQP